jgi:hypothetical protein
MKKLLSILMIAVLPVAITATATVAHAENAPAPTKKRLTMKSGVILEVTTTKDSAGNDVNTITAVFASVTNSSTGQLVEIPVNSPLVGSTGSGVGSGASSVIQITPAGSNTPLTPTQVSASLTGSVNTAVTTAINAGTLPPNTTPPVITPAPLVVDVTVQGGGSQQGPGNSNGNGNSDGKGEPGKQPDATGASPT